MVKNLIQPDMDDTTRLALQKAMDNVKIEKRGICNHEHEIYHCAVDMTIKMPGQTSAITQTMMVHLTKGKNGWEAVDG